MFQKNKKSRKLIPGYTLIPNGDHYVVRKIGITGDRIKKDPAFGVTRKWANEFGKATKMSKIIRDAFLSEIALPNTPRLLTSSLVTVLRTDNVSGFGDRDFAEADFSTLTGFHFNPAFPFEQLVKLTFCLDYNITRRQVELTMPAFIPAQCIEAPGGYSHFSFTFSCVGINAKEMYATLRQDRSRLLPLGGVKIPRKKLVFDLPDQDITVCLLTASIKFHNISILKKKQSKKDTTVPLTIIGIVYPFLNAK